MNKVKFSDEIWNNTIKPLLEYKIRTDDQLYLKREDISGKSTVCKDIESWYISLRDGIKKNFMLQNSGRLDRHKVCACIYIALVECPSLKVKNGSLEKERLINAEVAFIATCRILYSFIMDDAKNDLNFEAFLNSRKILCFPKNKNIDSSESYFVQTIKTLCHAQTQNKLSTLMLANIFYMLEECTDSAYRESK